MQTLKIIQDVLKDIIKNQNKFWERAIVSFPNSWLNNVEIIRYSFQTHNYDRTRLEWSGLEREWNKMVTKLLLPGNIGSLGNENGEIFTLFLSTKCSMASQYVYYVQVISFNDVDWDEMQWSTVIHAVIVYFMLFLTVQRSILFKNFSTLVGTKRFTFVNQDQSLLVSEVLLALRINEPTEIDFEYRNETLIRTFFVLLILSAHTKSLSYLFLKYWTVILLYLKWQFSWRCR